MAIRSVWTVVMGDQGYHILARADVGTRGVTPQPHLGRFDTYVMAVAAADETNERAGYTQGEVIRTVLEAMSYELGATRINKGGAMHKARERALEYGYEAVWPYLTAYTRLTPEDIVDFLSDLEEVLNQCANDSIGEAAQERALEERADKLGSRY